MKIYHLRGYCADLFEQGTYPLSEVFATLEEAKARMTDIRNELEQAFKDVMGEEYEYMTVEEAATYNNRYVAGRLKIELTSNPSLPKHKETLLQFGVMTTFNHMSSMEDVKFENRAITYEIANLTIRIEELKLPTDESK